MTENTGDKSPIVFTRQELDLVGNDPEDRQTQLLARIGDGSYTDSDATELAAIISGQAPARKIEGSEVDEGDLQSDGVPRDWLGYTVPDRADGEARSDLDRRLIDGALQRWHTAGMPQRFVTAALRALDEAEGEAAKLHDEAMEAAHRHATAALQAEWGPRYAAEVGQANAWIRSQLNAALADHGGTKALMQARLPDGTRIGDLAGFVRWANTMAKQGPVAGKDEVDDEEADVMPRSETGLAALAERKRQILALMHTDEKAYARAQPELKRIVAELNARGAG